MESANVVVMPDEKVEHVLAKSPEGRLDWREEQILRARQQLAEATAALLAQNDD